LPRGTHWYYSIDLHAAERYVQREKGETFREHLASIISEKHQSSFKKWELFFQRGLLMLEVKTVALFSVQEMDLC
jgi:hypothetical protein